MQKQVISYGINRPLNQEELDSLASWLPAGSTLKIEPPRDPSNKWSFFHLIVETPKGLTEPQLDVVDYNIRAHVNQLRFSPRRI